ncbi:MAG TPA: aconitate hydratase AcnA [Candidatus Binatus sp.]|nr:aconitate hydratase AcnA [Candidatus Binatus sp.]
MISARQRLASTPLDYYSLNRLAEAGFGDPARLPITVKILLEGLLRLEDAGGVSETSLRALTRWPERPPAGAEVPYLPSRVLLQDFTGVPAVLDLAAMRSAMQRAGKDAGRIDPLVQADLVIDHSVQVDAFGSLASYARNIEREYERNGERYAILRWAQQAFHNFSVVPPGMGICHQVNLERLSRVVQVRNDAKGSYALPDTLLGTDSHTTMVNGLGVLGWGVGGIEAEAALLGQPTYLPTPVVVGVRTTGSLRPGATATDLVLTLTEMLRAHGVVNKFVEFCGAGLSSLSVPDRATLSNMCPEYGATAALFPVDQQTLRYLETTGRDRQLIELVDRYTREQGMFRTDQSATPVFDELLELDLDAVEPSVAGPKRPQDRVALPNVWQSFKTAFAMDDHPGNNDVARFDNEGGVADTGGEHQHATAVKARPAQQVRNGSVVIAAITSCTNTSNPSVMVAAGLLAKRAVERGLRVSPTVKTSLAPGSRVVTDYLKAAGLMPYLEELGFYLVGYGCTTCIGNSGPLASAEVEAAVEKEKLNVVAVLSGNRNFEGRIHPLVRASYLASPPLVVAYALAGDIRRNLATDPLGKDKNGKDVFLRELWPTAEEVNEAIRTSLKVEMFTREYERIFDGDENWQRMSAPTGPSYDWDPKSTYVREPPFFEGMSAEPAPLTDIVGARALVILGDSITTDHISPAGSIPPDSPAGRYLIEHGVERSEFNSYGARRGNHEVLVRGTFGNIRLRNQLTAREGYWTTHLPDAKEMTIFDASERYRAEGVPLVAIAGKEYGSGSSRDWAAKGPLLLGIRAVLAESFERIHRSNLVGMGILPLEFLPGESLRSLGLNGTEAFTIRGLAAGLQPGQRIEVEAAGASGGPQRFAVVCRLDNQTDVQYLRHGGVLPMVLRQLMEG